MTTILTKGQKKAIKEIAAGKNVFITSKAGCGKSFLVSEIKNIFGSSETQFCSSTGISAINIGGSTLHSFFNLGLLTEPKEQIVYKMISSDKYRNKVAAIKNISMVVIDEVSMISDKVLEYVDYIAKKIRGSDKPMGGIQTILVGDFLQLPPVLSSKDEGYVLNSKIWNSLNLEIVLLTEVKRQNDINFINLLDEIRSANISLKSKEILNKRIIGNFKEKEIKDIVFVTTHNRVAEMINEERISKLTGEEIVFFAEQRGNEFDLTFYKKNSLLKETLKLKQGCRVMLIVNLEVASGLANGTLGTIEKFDEDSGFPVVKFDNGDKRIIENYTFKYQKFCRQKKETEILCEITQVPLIPAYALTVHKMQGITLEKAVLDIGESFETGQAYTAISRVKSLDGLYFKTLDYGKIKAHPKIVEYYKILENL
jgi:ATP-dependent DNA helicase PIF1